MRLLHVLCLVGTMLLALAPPLRAGPLEDAIRAASAGDSDLEPFYAARAGAALWTGDEVRADRARLVLDHLSKADDQGLRAADYVTMGQGMMVGSTDLATEVPFEIELSRALIRYANDVRTGRLDARAFNDDASLAPLRKPGPAILAEAAAAADLEAWLQALPPPTPAYDRLRTALALYRAQAQRGGFTPVPSPARRKLQPGDRDPVVVSLRRHLQETGDLRQPATATAAADGDLYDQQLASAVQRFQDRHGLDADGVIGPATIAALQIPIERKIEQIRLNLERRRWLPADLGSRYIFVNIADFHLKLVENERTIHSARVVVGKQFTSTPTFSRNMTFLVTNPYWNVPPSIAIKEILPAVRRDPGYLAKNRFEVIGSSGGIVSPKSVDWAHVGAKSFPYRFRQRSGPGNALGELKFMFPNEFNVYLHDTPSKTLFAKSMRAFSHGCVRVEDPRTLAVLLLAAQGWTRERLDSVLAQGKPENTIALAEPVPVHVTYLTAWANRDGTIHFRDDVYGRDAKLATALRRAEGLPES